MNSGLDGSASETAEVKSEYMRTAWICGALMFSLLLFAAAVELLRIRGGDCARGELHGNESLLDVFYLVAFVAFIVVRVYRRRVLLKPKGHGETGERLKRLRTVSIVTFLLCETPALLGAALFAAAGYYREFYGFFLYSMLLMVLYFPRLNQWERWLNTGKGY